MGHKGTPIVLLFQMISIRQIQFSYPYGVLFELPGIIFNEIRYLGFNPHVRDG